jgi:hypothetical protein
MFTRKAACFCGKWKRTISPALPPR